MITDEERVTLLWAAREVEAAIKAGDIKRARELIAAQHAIIEDAWQRAVQAERTIQADCNVALSQVAGSNLAELPAGEWWFICDPARLAGSTVLGRPVPAPPA